MPPRSCCTTILLGEYLAQLAYKLGDKCHTISCVKLTTLTVWSPTDRCNVRLAVIGNTHRRIHYIFAQLGRSRRWVTTRDTDYMYVVKWVGAVSLFSLQTSLDACLVGFHNGAGYQRTILSILVSLRRILRYNNVSSPSFCECLDYTLKGLRGVYIALTKATDLLGLVGGSIAWLLPKLETVRIYLQYLSSLSIRNICTCPHTDFRMHMRYGGVFSCSHMPCLVVDTMLLFPETCTWNMGTCISSTRS